MTAAIAVSDLTRRYGDCLALDGVTMDVADGSITGLLGRNGAGKTTLLRIITAQEFASAGSVRVLGADPVENGPILRRMVCIRGDQTYPDIPIRQALRVAAWFYPEWDEALARTLVAEFDLPLRRRMRHLSQGMRSAVGIIIGLAARADVTLFDEPTAGLDAVARQLFYDRLLAAYAGRPRTVLLSTHLIDEVAGLLERVVVLHRGRVALQAATDALRGSAVRVSGPAAAVEAFSTGRQTGDTRRVGAQATVVVAGPLDDSDLARVRAHHLEVAPLSLQQLVVHAATQATADARERTSV